MDRLIIGLNPAAAGGWRTSRSHESPTDIESKSFCLYSEQL
jgi:hypothetical protein